MSRGQKVTREKFLDSLDLYTCQISSNSIGGFSRSATGRAFPYWGKITTRARQGPYPARQIFNREKESPTTQRRVRVVMGICPIRTIGARQRANGLSSVGEFLRFYDTLFVIKCAIVSFSTCNNLKSSIKLKKGFKKQVKYQLFNCSP